MNNSINIETVSIYMPTHNRPDKAIRAIKSIQNQTYKDFKLIIIDDFSEMELFNKIKSYLDTINDKRIKLIRNEKSMGAQKSRNIGLSYATGKYITGIDDDDYWTPNRLKHFIDSSDDENLLLYSDDYFLIGKKTKLWSKKEIITLDEILRSNCIGNQMFVNSRLWQETGYFDEKLTAGQDHDMWIRLIEKAKFAKKIDSAEQYVELHTGVRISRNKKLKDYAKLYFKHKAKMNNEQMKEHLAFILLSFKKVKLSLFIKLLLLFDFKTAIRLLKKRILKKWYVI